MQLSGNKNPLLVPRQPMTTMVAAFGPQVMMGGGYNSI